MTGVSLPPGVRLDRYDSDYLLSGQLDQDRFEKIMTELPAEIRERVIGWRMSR